MTKEYISNWFLVVVFVFLFVLFLFLFVCLFGWFFLCFFFFVFVFLSYIFSGDLIDIGSLGPDYLYLAMNGTAYKEDDSVVESGK